MKNSKKSKKNFFLSRTLLIVLIISIISPLAHAWGIAYSESSFTSDPGGIVEVKFSLQNYVGDDPKRIIIELSGDKEIAEVLNQKDYYLLPPKTKDYEVIVKVLVPQPAKKSYKIDVNFIAYSGGEGIGISTAKVIPIIINVPAGTLSKEESSASPETPLDLTKTYQVMEEKIQEEKGAKNAAPASSLSILEEKNSLSLLPVLVIILVACSLMMTGTVFLQRKRRKKLGLIQ